MIFVFFCSRVLIVDDDEDDFVIVCDILRDGFGLCYIMWVILFIDGVACFDVDIFDVALIDFYFGAEIGFDLFVFI